MKKMMVIIGFVFIGFLLCSDNKKESPVGREKNPVEGMEELNKAESASTSPSQDVVAYREKYQLVIRDGDGWEVMLNFRKRKKIPWKVDSLWTYQGHLIYPLASYIIKGYATALYDPRTENFIVCAKDSAWNRGNIIYSWKYVPGSDKMEGNYHYHLSPHRMNDAPSTIEKGVIPGPGIPPEYYPFE